MTVIRRRKPRFEFVQILNAVARDYRVSWRARGLLVELLSYPADYETSTDDLVKRAKRQGGNVEGRDAMRAAARELKTVGYIIETRSQDERGRWQTDLEVTDDPMYDLLTGDGVSAGHTDDGFPGVGKPGVGEPGVSPNTEKNTETKTSPPSPPQAPDSGAEPSGREDEDATTTTVDSGALGRAESVVEDAISRWPSKHRAPGPRDRHRLSERVAAELMAGGDERTILDELTRDLVDAGSAVKVLLGNRTKVSGWGRRSLDPRPDAQRYEPTGPKPIWCGACEERTRLVAYEHRDGSQGMRRCRHCHPEADQADAGTPEVTEVDEPDPSALDGDVLGAMQASLTGAPAPDEAGGMTKGERERLAVRERLAALQQQS